MFGKFCENIISGAVSTAGGAVGKLTVVCGIGLYKNVKGRYEDAVSAKKAAAQAKLREKGGEE